jgi:hypothetical protein
VASGCLGRSHSAATFNPAVPDSGCFWRCSLSDALEASSTRLEADVEEWQSSATNDDLKIGSQGRTASNVPELQRADRRQER